MKRWSVVLLGIMMLGMWGCISTRTQRSNTCRAQVNRCVDQCQAQQQLGQGDWRNLQYACMQRCYELCK
ncbi:MAG: hypothetical protein H6728_00020 [Myxococcales bacterium]|nr:hypothetical protein [Myxococcales bacterium]MCB9641447.1 hypothetical protein [Myxococcales bacterium]